MNRALWLATVVFSTPLISLSSLAQAQEVEDEDLVSYDVIVKDLSSQNEQQTIRSNRAQQPKSSSSGDAFDNVLIHFGAGYATTMQSVSLPSGSKSNLNQKGFQAALGIDLFSPNWIAEGTARSFGDSEDANTRISLKEFDLKILFKDMLTPRLGFRAGAGLSARYMTIKDGTQEIGDYTTPSSVGTLGLDFFLSKGFSLGLDVSARTAMISETLDRNSYDATFRMDTHF